MEEYEKKILDAIQQDVQAESQMVLETLNQEIKQLHDEKLMLFERSLKQETEHYVEKEWNDLRIAAANQKSQVKFDYMTQLLNLRSQYMKEIVNEVKDKLRVFVKTEEYKSYLKHQLSTCSIQESGYFVVKEEDKDMMKSLLKEKGYQNRLETAYFQFGGFRYIDEEQGIEFSCELKERLEENLEWFRGHSGFILEGQE